MARSCAADAWVASADEDVGAADAATGAVGDATVMSDDGYAEVVGSGKVVGVD